MLVGVVAFWWAGVVVPRLVNLVFPEWALPRTFDWDLNPGREGSLANAVSAGTLATVALLALANALACARRRSGWLAIGGWTVLGVMTAGIAVEEVAELKPALVQISNRLGHPVLWPLVLAPVVVPFLVLMGVFVWRSLRARSVRVPIVLGLFAWIFGLWHEMGHPYFLAGRAPGIGILLEETLEFCGTLLIGYGAAMALHGSMDRDRPVFGGRWRIPLVASAAAVVALGGLVVLLVFRAPIIDLRQGHALHVSLPDQWSLVQEMRMPATPIGQIGIQVSLGRPFDGRSRSVGWRLIRGSESGEVLREGRMNAVAISSLSETTIDIVPPLDEPEGERVSFQIVADVGPPATNDQFWHGLEIRAVKGVEFPGGRIWINGVPSWPDQSLEFVAYSAPEPTWTKLQAVWRTFTTNWKWAVLAVSFSGALTLIGFVPMVLVAAALPTRWTPP